MEFLTVSNIYLIKGEKRDIKDISWYPKVTNVDFRDSSFFEALSN